MTASRRRLLTGPLLGKCRRRAIPQPGMPPLAVVEHLDVLRNLSPSLLPRIISPMVHQLIFQCPPETLHRRVVIAIALPAHGGDHAELPQLILIVVGTILGATVGVVDQARAWAFRPDRVPQGVAHQVRRHPGPHGIPDYLTRIQIFNPCQIQPSFPCREWSERPGVVALSPSLSSPNRTCTSQRIRLSIQALRNAKATSA